MTASFKERLSADSLELKRNSVSTLQINLGKLCNQACRHCHVEAGPTKTAENMDEKTALHLIRLIEKSSLIKTLDITGGAPELNPYFREFVKVGKKKNIEVIDRCNLTVLFEKGQEDTAQFLADNEVTVVASLPCYSRTNVDKQRGNGVFDKSIRALQQLNQLGYAKSDKLKLSLVYNPLGPTLPPDQNKLQEQYKVELMEDFGIQFNKLYTITNMPIKRFLTDLLRQNKLDEYMSLLANSFNVRAFDNVMCKEFISISWDGRIYDCDFNQMLGIEVASSLPRSVWDINSFETYKASPIQVANHCFGCTAGAGSSCTGSLSAS
ncbi:MAG: arsenosugar biosynthesis radical SAM protein ArsS [Bdellovibrionota bacterium]